MIWALILAIMTTLMGTQTTKGCEQGAVLPLLTRHKVQVLLEAGFSVAEVAARSGASVDSVARIAEEQPVHHVDDRRAARERRIGRPSKAAPLAPKVAEWLHDEPELPTQELLRRAKEHGYTGNKSAFYGLVAGLRPPRATPVVRFEGLPGEFSQHDFGQVDVRFVDGR